MFLRSLDLIKCLAQASSFFHFKPLHPCRHGEAVAAGDSASLGWLAFAVNAGGGAGGASAGGGLSYTEAGVVQAEGRDGPEEEELGQVWWAAQH